METVAVLCSLRCCIINVAKCAMAELCGWHSTINIGNFTIAYHLSIQYKWFEVRRTVTKTEQSTSQRLLRQVSNVATFITKHGTIKNESTGTSISVICRTCKIQPAHNVSKRRSAKAKMYVYRSIYFVKITNRSNERRHLHVFGVDRYIMVLVLSFRDAASVISLFAFNFCV